MDTVATTHDYPEDTPSWDAEDISWDSEELRELLSYDSPYCDGCGCCACYGCILECGCRFNCTKACKQEPPFTTDESMYTDIYDSPYCDGCGMCTCYGCILECGCRFNCMGDVVHKLPPAELRIRADELNRERIKGFAYFIPGK
jgi:hypothetical protein